MLVRRYLTAANRPVTEESWIGGVTRHCSDIRGAYPRPPDGVPCCDDQGCGGQWRAIATTRCGGRPERTFVVCRPAPARGQLDSGRPTTRDPLLARDPSSAIASECALARRRPHPGGDCYIGAGLLRCAVMTSWLGAMHGGTSCLWTIFGLRHVRGQDMARVVATRDMHVRRRGQGGLLAVSTGARTLKQARQYLLIVLDNRPA